MDYDSDARASSMRTLVLAVGSAVLYAVCAISMNFTNKAALMVFPYANTLLFIQMLTVLAVILPLRALRIVNFPALSAKKARALMPVTILYAGNVSCALLGLRLLNVPMYSTLKRLTPMMVLLTKWRMTHHPPSRGIFASVALVVLGCFIAGAGDLSFDLRGYCFALASCMLQAAYLLLVEFSGAKQGVTTSELLTYNAVLSLPFISAVVMLSGEGFEAIPAITQAISSHGAWYTLLLLATCSLSGVALNFSMFLCTSLNSALTTTIVGTLKGVVATTLGFFLLGGVEMHAVNVAGIVLNATGGAMYSVVKYRSRAASKKIANSGGSGASSGSGSPLLPCHSSNGAYATSGSGSGDVSPTATPRPWPLHKRTSSASSPKGVLPSSASATDIDSAFSTPTSSFDSLLSDGKRGGEGGETPHSATTTAVPTSPWVVARKPLSITRLRPVLLEHSFSPPSPSKAMMPDGSLTSIWEDVDLAGGGTNSHRRHFHVDCQA